MHFVKRCAKAGTRVSSLPVSRVKQRGVVNRQTCLPQECRVTTNLQHNEVGFPTSRFVTCTAQTRRESLIRWGNCTAQHNVGHVQWTESGAWVQLLRFNDPLWLRVDHTPSRQVTDGRDGMQMVCRQMWLSRSKQLTRGYSLTAKELTRYEMLHKSWNGTDSSKRPGESKTEQDLLNLECQNSV
jgi:hypothetical protein